MKRPPVRLVRNPFSWLIRFFAELGALTRFTGSAVASVFRPPYKKSIMRRQMDEIGVGSIPIVTMTGLFTGLVLALQSIVELRNIGATSYMGRAIGTTVIRELGPVLCSMMVAARAGSAISAELASMTLNEQIDALRAEGSDPIKKLVEPRLLACILMVPVLSVICESVAFAGAWIVARRDVQISSFFYWDSVLEVLTPAFIWGGVVKSFAFGFIIGIISCYSGMKTGFSSSGVGKATTRSIVLSSVAILAVDFLLTKLFTLIWW